MKNDARNKLSNIVFLDIKCLPVRRSPSSGILLEKLGVWVCVWTLPWHQLARHLSLW